jgi:hypothetical protein
MSLARRHALELCVGLARRPGFKAFLHRSRYLRSSTPENSSPSAEIPDVSSRIPSEGVFSHVPSFNNDSVHESGRLIFTLRVGD